MTKRESLLRAAVSRELSASFSAVLFPWRMFILGVFHITQVF